MWVTGAEGEMCKNVDDDSILNLNKPRKWIENHLLREWQKSATHLNLLSMQRIEQHHQSNCCCCVIYRFNVSAVERGNEKKVDDDAAAAASLLFLRFVVDDSKSATNYVTCGKFLFPIHQAHKPATAISVTRWRRLVQWLAWLAGIGIAVLVDEGEIVVHGGERVKEKWEIAEWKNGNFLVAPRREEEEEKGYIMIILLFSSSTNNNNDSKKKIAMGVDWVEWVCERYLHLLLLLLWHFLKVKCFEW